ncbi:MAG: ATP-binding protein [Pseudomonadota bacterium]
MATNRSDAAQSAPRPVRGVFRWSLWIALYLALPIGVLWLLYIVDQPYNLSESYRVRSADWIASMDNRPPSSGWRALGADAQPKRDPTQAFTSVWFRFTIPPSVAKPALYLPYPNGNFDVWVDTQRLLQTGRVRKPLRYHKAPIVVPLDAASEPGEQYVFVRMTRQSSYPLINYAYIAPVEDALRDADEQLVLQRDIPLTVLAVMSVFGGLVALMFFFRRGQTAYGWYALTTALWALDTSHALYHGVFFHHFAWYSLTYIFLMWLVAELYFVNRYFKIPAPRLERAITGVSIVACVVLFSIALLALDSQRFERFYYNATVPFTLWTTVIAFVVSSRYFVAVRKSFTFDSVSLWLASGIVIGVGIRDICYELGIGNVPGSVYYLQFVAMIPLVLFGIQLMRRFASDSRNAERLNRELKQMVASRTADLELTSRRLTNEERRRVLAEERSRLMRDMHDGLGGQLVHALALSEQGKDRDLERSLRLALDDLRLIVDSLTPSENSLQDLLASYRHRVSKMLQRSGFTVDWILDDCATQIALKPNTALSILRIMQEAVTNAVRHSGGDHLVIRLRETADRLQLSVTDNGRGIEPGQTERGMRNMRVRAEEIGAQLTITTQSGETSIRVCLPLDFQDITVV